jgi:cell wall-associated NlpC family hydrolase
MLACGYFRFYALTRMEKRTKGSNEAASFACEAASSIRTVATLSLEKHLLAAYHGKLGDQARDNFKFQNVSGVLYATSQGLSMLIFALVFWYGGRLLFSGEYTVLQFFIIYSAIINGAQSAGAIFSFAPDMGEARDAAKVLKSFVNRIPKIDNWSTDGKKVESLEGKVQLQDVRFTYPGRPDHRVLRGVSIRADPGQFIALVGASGSGKSTVMQLLERFYDPTSGDVLVDEVPLTDYNLQEYRAQLAIVSQETTLYTGTIRDNILADKDDIPEDVVIQATKDANIYDFIVSPTPPVPTYFKADSPRCPYLTASTPSLAQKAPSSPAANANASPSPARSSATPKSSFSTKPPPHSTPHPNASSKPRSTSRQKAAQRLLLRIASARFSTQMLFMCLIRARWWRWGGMRSWWRRREFIGSWRSCRLWGPRNNDLCIATFVNHFLFVLAFI